ncbi:unnamed protein product, partial [Adineta steineri]
KHPTINVPFGTPATVRGVSMPRDTTNSNVESFKVTFYGTTNQPINKQPLESTPSGDKNHPASLNPSQIPSDVLVKRVEITDIKTTDNQPPRGVVLDIKACTEATAGTTPVHGSEASHATGTGITSASGSATGVTSASGSTTVGASGTTTKQCQEMEAVDDAVSKTITVTPKDIDQNKKGDFKPDSKTGVNFPEEDKHPTINIPFGTPATVRGVSMPRDTTNSNVESFKVTFYGTTNQPINKQPLESTPSGDKNHPASLNPSQIPSDVPVKRVEITDIKTTDNQPPRGVVLDIKACTEATAGTTGVSAGTTLVHGSEASHATGTAVTSPSGSASVATSASGSTTVGVSGTTTKQCQEMEAVDDAVSKTITVTPKDIDQNKKGDFKPDSKTGVNFPEEDKHPTINIPFGTPATVRGVSMPRDTTNNNVESFKVTFYGTTNQPINKQPLESTPSGDKNHPASLNPSQIPSDVLVKRVEITDIKTTDNQAPRGVVLDIKACTEATAAAFDGKYKLHFLHVRSVNFFSTDGQ